MNDLTTLKFQCCDIVQRETYYFSILDDDGNWLDLFPPQTS